MCNNHCVELGFTKIAYQIRGDNLTNNIRAKLAVSATAG